MSIITTIIIVLVIIIIPIEVVLLLKVISHGDDVHRLQQPVALVIIPVVLLQVTDIDTVF